MPDDKTPEKETKVEKTDKPAPEKSVKAQVFSDNAQSDKPSKSVEPYVKALAPNSPWKKLHADSSIGTYVMEIRDAGILVRTESPKENSESMVFLPNVKIGQLPSCE